MDQWVRGLVSTRTQVQIHRALVKGRHDVCNLRTVGAETGGSVEFAGCQPRSRFSGRPCLYKSKMNHDTAGLLMLPGGGGGAHL